MSVLGPLLEARAGREAGELQEAFYRRRDFRGRFADMPDAGIVSPLSSVKQTPDGSAPKRPAKIEEKDLPGKVGSGVWTKAVKDSQAFLAAGGPRNERGEVTRDTEHRYRAVNPDGSLGDYTPERAQLHGRIVDLLTQHAAVQQPDPQAVFMAGGGASGKSSVLKSPKKLIQVDHEDAVDINPDIVRTMLPEYGPMIAAGDETAAEKTHEEASYVAKMVQAVAMARRQHVIVDGVGGGPPGKFAGKVEAARDAGYRTEVHLVSVDTDEAVSRAKKRAERSGRAVPEDRLRAGHQESARAFVDDIAHVEGVPAKLWDNHLKDNPRLVATKSATERKLEVQNRKAFERFLKKAKAADRTEKG